MTLLALAQRPGREPGTGGRRLLSLLGPILVLGAVVLLGGLTQYLKEGHLRYLSPTNQALILTQTVMVAVAAVGMTIVIISGGIDLSVGSVVALTAVAAAWVVRALAPEGAAALEGPGAAAIAVLALLAAVAVGAAVGATSGAIVTGLRIPPFIATLGMMALARGAAKWLGGNMKIDAPATWISGFTRATLKPLGWFPASSPAVRAYVTDAAVSPAVLAALAVAVAAAVVLRHTRFGRHVFAIGSSEATARLCGVAVERTKVLLYTAAGALFGLAGAMAFGYNSVGDPTGAVGMELEVIAAVVIGGGSLSGGSGTIFGTIVGALLVANLRNLCRLLDLPDYYSDMVVGAVIVGAVALDRLRHRRAG
jgi:ribose transport system permease protein